MGIRLYPRTNKPEALEMIRGVPAGTAEKLQAIDLKYDRLLANCTEFHARNDVEYARHSEIVKDADVDRYHGFLLFGWGRFDWQLTGNEYSGTVKKEDEISVLAHHGVKLTQEQLQACEGLCWS